MQYTKPVTQCSKDLHHDLVQEIIEKTDAQGKLLPEMVRVVDTDK